MAYAFYQNSFAPKCPSVIINSDTNKIHSVSYNKCNFSCEYCFFKYYKDISNYKDVSEKEYEDITMNLLSMVMHLNLQVASRH